MVILDTTQVITIPEIEVRKYFCKLMVNYYLLFA